MFFLNHCGTEWPILCWYVVKKLLTRSLTQWKCDVST